MPEQRELPLTFPELAPEAPLIPVRMVNEYVYCPRLAYLEWVQGEFAHSADAVDGAIKHKRVDKKSGNLPEQPDEAEKIHARSVALSSMRLGITAKLDLVEGEGSTMLSAPALRECFRRNISVSWHTYGGWFVGHTIGTGHHNVETRTFQHQASFDPKRCLQLARGWVAAKIANCRTLLRRNWRGKSEFEGADTVDDAGEADVAPAGGQAPPELLIALREDAAHATKAVSIEVLLGVEGAAANRYFQNFSALLKSDTDPTTSFDFMGRNRRPPKDPVNALLSFAYAMLTREWTITLSAVGLDPYRGFRMKTIIFRGTRASASLKPT
ncbi:MAG: CRISPR-associated endonuclease Cas1 [Betaproteobacteria bacterium]|nr:CRISPR-associated endonuclease Cas1 [Betaproteobacteria bacterium]